MSTAPWLTETIRFSSFGEPPTHGRSLLLDLFSIQPEHINERPAQSFRQEAARFGRFRIIVSRTPGRLDVVFADLAEANTSDPTRSDYKPFFEIGDYDDVFPAIRPHIHNLVRNLKNTARLAYAPTLLAHAQMPSDANRLLADKLPNVHFNPDTDSDVLWQINRPRIATSSQVRINRISKWHTIAVQSLQIFPPMSQAVLNTETMSAARVEIDVNTAPNQALVGADFISIIDELATLARELIERGDIE